MINPIFTDAFNFLTSSLNSLNSENSKSKNSKPSDSLKRLLDTVQFIYNKKTVFNTNLDSVKQELIQMKREAASLKNEFSKWTNTSLVFTIESLIDSLIVEVDVEIEKRKNQAKEKADLLEKLKKEQKNNSPSFIKPKTVKVKIFKSAFSEVVEKEMNEFLTKNDVEITNTLQNIENDVVCITLFYK